MRKHGIIQKCIQQVLLLLCTGFYLGHTWADANIVTFYVTNEGIITTIGLESEAIPDHTFSAGIGAKDCALLFYYPNLNNSVPFLAVLDLLMQRHRDDFIRILTDEKHKACL